GLVIAAYLFLNGLLRRRELRKEVRALKDQLHRQMTINDKGNEQVLAEVERLRKENENLRITAATLKAKPGRAELVTLNVYDRAIRLLHQRAPGFAPAWEGVLTEAQKEVELTDTGLLAMVRKVFRPSLAAGAGVATDPGSTPETVDAEEVRVPRSGPTGESGSRPSSE
ncbi:MAG: hypothetical protein KDM81_23100, partial [Verrucomicrobiae bacterium]|nr:hypothetical protein [Verrucomicrobiae bacterium]